MHFDRIYYIFRDELEIIISQESTDIPTNIISFAANYSATYEARVYAIHELLVRAIFSSDKNSSGCYVYGGCTC